MTKLTRYTSFEDLKASKNAIQPQKSNSERESDFKEFISLVRSHSSTSTPEHSKSGKSLNQSNRGK
jgi:hypothetical protein